MSIKRLTKEEIGAICTMGTDAVCELVNQLEDQIEEFGRRLGLNSSNSSKPPSTDIGKKKNNNSRISGKRQPGGQKGHKGKTLKPVDEPDQIISCQPDECNCGHQFTGIEMVMNTERRQIIDIPRPTVSVTEFKSITYLCPGCGQLHTGKFPDGVNAPVQYGNNLQAYVVYLMNYQLLPYKRTADLLENLHNLPISVGTLRNIQSRFARLIKEPVEFIKQCIINSEVAHFDETGFYSTGKRHWLHVASTLGYTFYFYHHKRGFNAIEAAGILPVFKGKSCHDYWKPYYLFTGCEHSLCNAHHLRDLQGVVDSTGYFWAEEMKLFLQESKKTVDAAKSKGLAGLPKESITDLDRKYQSIISKGYKETPPPPERKPGQRGKLKKGKALNLLERLDQRREEILDFIYDFKNPFDNNQAERDIRMMKTKQKISGTFRSGDMAQTFCTIRSYISTAIKQGMNVFDAVAGAFEKKFFVYEQA